MQFKIVSGSLDIIQSFPSVLFVEKGYEASDYYNKSLTPSIIEIIKKFSDARNFKAESNSSLVVDAIIDGKQLTIVLVGLGDAEKVGFHELMLSAGTASRKCSELRIAECSVVLPELNSLPSGAVSRAVSTGFQLASYEFGRYKTPTEDKVELGTVNIITLSPDTTTEVADGVKMGEQVSKAICFARDLGNEPSNVVTPTYLADIARQIADRNGLELEVWDRARIESEKFGLLSAVARGSKQEPRFIHLTYKHTEATKTIALVGKGITFDTGGYNLKGGGSMESMKDDMSGAADVLAAIDCISAMGIAVNVHALVPSTENCIGGNAIHPGDIFRAYSGKMVEINNTDAEGRLILADAVAYARSLGVDEMVDLATLTGACVTALGTHISGMVSNNDDLADSLLSASVGCGEKLYRLPLDKVYMDELKSNVADLKNCGGRQAGVIVGGLFIGEFVGDTHWAHIDLSAATLDGDTAIARKGSSGAGVGTLVEYVLRNEKVS